jgi:hypothetical protein
MVLTVDNQTPHHISYTLFIWYTYDSDQIAYPKVHTVKGENSIHRRNFPNLIQYYHVEINLKINHYEKFIYIAECSGQDLNIKITDGTKYLICTVNDNPCKSREEIPRWCCFWWFKV